MVAHAGAARVRVLRSSSLGCGMEIRAPRRRRATTHLTDSIGLAHGELHPELGSQRRYSLGLLPASRLSAPAQRAGAQRLRALGPSATRMARRLRRLLTVTPIGVRIAHDRKQVLGRR